MEEEAARALARRAGVDGSYVQRLAELGILTNRSAAPDSLVRQVKVIQNLERAGLPREALAEAIRRGELSLAFVDQPSYNVFASFESETFREVAARTGVPVETLLVIREAMGFSPAAPDDHIRTDELEVLPALETQIGAGVRPAAIERWLRVFGDSLRRMADTESDWWRTDVLEPLFRSGHRAADIGDMTAEIAGRLTLVSDAALLALYHGQQAHAWMRNIFEGVEAALGTAGLHTRQEHVPAICFLDLTGYTRLTEQRGDAAAAELAHRLVRLVQGTSARYGGKPVKWLGDGVMFHFGEPGQAVVAALEMVAATEGDELPPAHVGVHAGPVLFQDGDYFGRTVNVASRIADYAREGQVVVSQAVVDAADGTSVAFEDVGLVELKGVAEPVRLYEAVRSETSPG
ncbi:MAG: adenylate/guanylate cyclase domain-containing protein [Chloroflexota bacterium]